MMKRIIKTGFVATGIALIFLLCAGLSAYAARPAQKNLILATTTSTQDSGLLDVLVPLFEKKTGYFVKTIAVGSGQAMAMGQKGDTAYLLAGIPGIEPHPEVEFNHPCKVVTEMSKDGRYQNIVQVMPGQNAGGYR